jgi:hypothetical protein
MCAMAAGLNLDAPLFAELGCAVTTLPGELGVAAQNVGFCNRISNLL